MSHSPSLGGPPLPKAARASARSTPIPASAGGPCLAARAAVARPLPPLLRAAADSGLDDYLTQHVATRQQVEGLEAKMTDGFNHLEGKVNDVLLDIQAIKGFLLPQDS